MNYPVPRASSKLAKLRSSLAERGNLFDAASAFMVRCLSAVAGYGMQIALANILNLSEYGIYVTLWTWLIVANHLGVLGFSESALRFLPRYSKRGRDAWAAGFMRTGWIAVTATSTFLALALLSGLAVFGSAVPVNWLMPLALFALLIPVTAMELYIEGISRSFGWYMLPIVPPYIIRPLTIAALVAGLWWMGVDVTASHVLAIAVAVTAILVSSQAFVLRRRLIALLGKPEKATTRRVWVKASIPLALIVTVEEIFYWSDVLILGFLVPSEDVSLYFAALRSMALTTFVQYAFMLVSARKFSLANAGRDRAELQAKVREASSWTFVLSIPAVLLTLAAGYPLLRLFGPEFVEAWPVMAVIGLALLLRASVGQAVDLLTVLGRQKASLAIALTALGVNIIMSVSLVPIIGIMGAAIGTATAYGVRALLLFTYCRSKLEINVLPSVYALQKQS